MKTKIIPVETAIVVSLLCLALTTQGESITASNGNNVSIPEAGGGAVFSTITIADAPAGTIVTGVDVYFRCVHTYSGDLTIDLRADPAGNLGSYRLWNREGGSADNPTRTRSGISQFSMLSPNRTWYLVAQDWAGGDTGYIDEWTITVYYSKPTAMTYRGLFGAGDFSSSGPVTLSTTKKASFSAKLELAGKRYSFSGVIGTNGTYSKVVARKNLSDLHVDLNFRTAGRVTGQVSDGSWTSALTALCNTFNKTNPTFLAGQYTMLIPFYTDYPSESPHGSGFGTVRVKPSGQVKFAGKLPDGTKLVQTAYLSDGGDWPFYAALYGRKGAVAGWLTVTNADFDIDGNLSWHKPAMPRSKLYPNGFDCDTDNVLGKIYFPPAGGNPVLNLTSWQAWMASGNLPVMATALMNQDRINHFSQVSGNGDYGLELTIIPSSGLVKGSFRHPATQKKTSLEGAVLQSLDQGGGYFIGSDQSGPVEFGNDQ